MHSNREVWKGCKCSYVIHVYRPNQTFPDRREKETFKRKIDVTPNEHTVVVKFYSQNKHGHQE